MKRTRVAYTPVEMDLIRQLYPRGGSRACMAVMPNRTADGISTQAKLMGVRMEVAEVVRVPDPLNVTADAWRGPVNLGISTWRIAA